MLRERVPLWWVEIFWVCILYSHFLAPCVCRGACEAQLGGVCMLSERGTVSVHCLWILVLGVTAVASQLLMFPDRGGFLPLFSPSLLSPGMEVAFPVYGIKICLFAPL